MKPICADSTEKRGRFAPLFFFNSGWGLYRNEILRYNKYVDKQEPTEAGIPLKLTALKQYYGFSSFRPGQEPIIDAISDGRDVLAVMPTGAGKSVCYQIPAVLSEGITLVISPLISLMKDQVGALNQNGIRAAYLNSSLTPRQFSLALANARAGVYKIIYVAPERLLTDSFLEFAVSARISLVAVDEAHCVSQWGHDFRRSYTHIGEFVDALPRRPVLAAFTATATEQVKNDVRQLLGLRTPFEISTGFDRPNLTFSVIQTQHDASVPRRGSSLKRRITYIREYLDRNPGKSGIIYAMTRKNVEEVWRELHEAGYPVSMYHGGMEDAARAENQEAFIRDVKPIMVATNAFGMGIDKPDVAFILHFNMPLSMEAYYQEAGRAGRDGSEAECILLYTPADIRTAQFLIDHQLEDADEDEIPIAEREDHRRREMDRLQKMIRYCECTDCLRAYILRYFGEEPGRDSCGKCSSCLGSFEERDVSGLVLAVASAVKVTGQRFGIGFIVDFLRGDDSERMLRGSYSELPGFGQLSGESAAVIRDVIARMLEAGWLVRSEGEYPVLSLSPTLPAMLKSGQKLSMKFRQKAVPPRQKTVRDREFGGADRDLYERLRVYRKTAADRLGVPPYVIFTDSTLREIVLKRPLSMEELMDVRGIGSERAQKYGRTVIALVRDAKA